VTLSWFWRCMAYLLGYDTV